MAVNDRNKDDNINAKDFLIGSLVGGIVGTLAALLLAPKSGKELRSDLNNQAHVLREKTDQIRSTAMVKSGELGSSVKEKTSELSRKVSEQSVGLVHKVTGRKDEVNEIVTNNAVDELFEQDPQSDIQRKLEETKKAFDETESKINRE